MLRRMPLWPIAEAGRVAEWGRLAFQEAYTCSEEAFLDDSPGHGHLSLWLEREIARAAWPSELPTLSFTARSVRFWMGHAPKDIVTEYGSLANAVGLALARARLGILPDSLRRALARCLCRDFMRAQDVPCPLELTYTELRAHYTEDLLRVFRVHWAGDVEAGDAVRRRMDRAAAVAVGELRVGLQAAASLSDSSLGTIGKMSTEDARVGVGRIVERSRRRTKLTTGLVERLLKI